MRTQHSGDSWLTVSHLTRSLSGYTPEHLIKTRLSGCLLIHLWEPCSRKPSRQRFISQELSFAFLDVPDRLADDRFLHPSNWASMNPCWRWGKSVVSSVIAPCLSRTGKAVTKVTGVKWFGERYFASCCVTGDQGWGSAYQLFTLQHVPAIPAACIFTTGAFQEKIASLVLGLVKYDRPRKHQCICVLLIFSHPVNASGATSQAHGAVISDFSILKTTIQSEYKICLRFERGQWGACLAAVSLPFFCLAL